jgi:hypothetical protein
MARLLVTGCAASAALGIAIAVAAPSPAHAVLRRHDRPDSLYQALANDSAPVLGNLAGAVGTLIGDRWVLTAGHVVLNLSPFSRSFRLGSERYPISDVYIYPGFAKQRGEGGGDQVDLEVPDMAIVLLARPVSGVAPARLHRVRDERGRPIVVAGNGITGTGESGPADGDGILRAATNVVDDVSGSYFTFSFSAPGDSGVTDLEGIGGPGDSGGPAFVRGADGLEVLGVSSLNHQGDAAGPSCYHSAEVYASVPASLAWIDEVLAGRGKPEPVLDVVRRVSDGWPDTPAGRLVSRWLDAYDRCDSLALVAFEREFRADSLLAKKSAEQRASSWLGYYKEWGRLDAARWVETAGEPMRVLVHASGPDRWMRFDFRLQATPPYRLTGMVLNWPEDPPDDR